jgi:putative alpha-1,2-mannosidase
VTLFLKSIAPIFVSNAWQYFWSVPQNVEGLIKTVGGRVLIKS